MIPQTPQADQFIARLPTRTIAKDAHVYICGDHDATVYAIVSGHVKLLALSPAGKQCLLSIYTAGAIFGELSLVESRGRRETATAMADTVVQPIPCTEFLRWLSRDALLEGFVRYLAGRIVLQRAAVPYGRFLGLPTVLHGGSEIMKPPLVGRTVLSLVPEEAFHRRRGSAAAVFGNMSGDGSSCPRGQPDITRPQGASGRRQEMSAWRA
jgi:hypothetical protein